MSNVMCPASMCPLIAPNGSPWTGKKDSICSEHDDLDSGGCPWWMMACSTGGHHQEVDFMERYKSKAFVIGPNQPKDFKGESKTYKCQREDECSWHKQALLKGTICPPRYAMSKGFDPRVVLF